MINPISERVRFANKSAVGDPTVRNFRYISRTVEFSPNPITPVGCHTDYYVMTQAIKIMGGRDEDGENEKKR